MVPPISQDHIAEIFHRRLWKQEFRTAEKTDPLKSLSMFQEFARNRLSLSHLAATVTTIIGALAIQSCGPLDVVDPSFAALGSSIERDPSHDAIVGMWHRGGLPGSEMAKVSLLFEQNGSGIVKEVGVLRSMIGEPETADIEPVSFTYHYSGDGTWLDSNGSKYWIAGGRLLREAKGARIDSYGQQHFMFRDVFDRMD